ncbi:hypothetical protein FB451DRAFT_1185841 [Mycena latifolia]|nr:hypothetical protein FB451DRAFT_1185841 [Mycena latifolia]
MWFVPWSSISEGLRLNSPDLNWYPTDTIEVQSTSIVPDIVGLGFALHGWNYPRLAPNFNSWVAGLIMDMMNSISPALVQRTNEELSSTEHALDRQPNIDRPNKFVGVPAIPSLQSWDDEDTTNV